MKIIPFLLAFLLLSASAATQSVTSLFNKITPSIVQIEFPTEEEGKPTTHVCAGFVVSSSQGLAVTAAHCVNPQADVFVDHKLSNIRKIDEIMAAVSIPAMSKPILELAKKVPPLGTPVVVVGYGYNHITVLPRFIANVEENDFGTDSAIFPGMSGGPIVDYDGKVVGIAQASNERFGIACGVIEIREFLKGIK